MTHLNKLLNVHMNNVSVDTHLLNVNLPHVPTDAPLNSPISPDEVSAAITALNRNKASIYMACAQSLLLMQLPY